jgi:zinc protease
VKTTRIAVLVLLIASMAVGQQVTPPPPAPPRTATVPQPVEKTLANGLRVIVVSKHDVPLVSARLMVKTGSEEDAPSFDGMARLTASLLTQGTKTRSAEEIARGVEALGTTLQSDAGWDYSQVDVNVMSSNFGKALGFVADVVRNPVFKTEEIERLRAQSIDSVRVALQSPLTLARYVASRVVFGGEKYGHSIAGTPESLERITREQIVEFHDRYYRPENAVLIVAGDVKAETVFARAQELFGSWQRTPGVMGQITDVMRPRAQKGRVVVVDYPEAGQAAVVVTSRGLKRTDPKFYAALVANSILGGGYSARLNQEIRIKRGLSYGAYSNFDLRRDVGPFSASTQTKNESAAEVAAIIIDELGRLGTAEIGENELTPRKAVLTGGFARSLETSAGVVDSLSELALYGISLDEINRYVGGVQAVAGPAVRDFAAGNVGGEGVSIVVVGDASKFIEPLRKRFGDVEVIPVADLDLDRTELRKPSSSSSE